MSMSSSLAPTLLRYAGFRACPVHAQRLRLPAPVKARQLTTTRAFLVDAYEEECQHSATLNTATPVSLSEPAQKYSSLSVGEMQRLLDEAGISHRDCFERGELLQRLQESEGRLQGDLRSRLDYMAQRRAGGEGASTSGASALAPTNMLFMDEQYVVSLFQAARQSVVNVTSLVDARGGPLGLNPMQVPQGTGSGFLWDSAGHIVTNWHVIRNAQSARVTLWNNETYEATLRGVEPDKDLAVLKIKKPPPPATLRPVTVGSSGGLQVGQRVFAIGNPFSLDQTLTGGLVSALGREIKGVTGRVIRDVVQTDAAINPGNSGGPLLDSRGRLIGVNTMIYSPSGASSGIGFAIPADTVKRVVNEIVRNGRVVRPGLGVVCLPDNFAASVLKSKEQRGVIIKEVMPGSGAAEAGLRGMQSASGWGKMVLGDVIMAVGGQRVACVEDLISAIERFSVGDQVPLTVQRDGRALDVQVPLLAEQRAAKPF